MEAFNHLMEIYLRLYLEVVIFCCFIKLTK